MLSISSQLKEESISGAAVPACKVKLKLQSGKILELTQSDLWQSGFSMDDATSGVGSFDIGQVITNRLKLSLNNSDEKYDEYDFAEAEVMAWRGGILQDGTRELLQCGIFTVHEHKRPDSSVDLTCLNFMTKTEKSYTEVSTAYPATIQTIVQDICNKCGIVLATSAIDNGSYVVGKRPNDEALTCRDMLHYAAQISGNYVRCNVYGGLEFRWYDETKQGHKITALKSFTPEEQDIVITGIQVTDAGEKKQSSLYGEKGYILEISDNPLIENGRAAEIATHLGRKIIGMQFRPLETSCIIDPSVEAGDLAEVIDRKGRKYRCWITNMTYTIGNDTKITCDAETPSSRAAVRYSETTKAIVESRRQIEEERTERELALKKLSQQLAEGSGMYVTAEKQEDGSTIYYTHDKPQLQDSQFVVKYTALAIGMSIDGGKTYPYGLSVSGQAILDRLYLIGLNATYIKTGKLQVCDAKGNILFCADMDTGVVTINSGILKVGKGFINTDGRFRLGPISSRNGRVVDGVYTDQDVYFDRAIFIDYGTELFGNNDSVTHTPYIDFHLGESADNPQTDYTARIEQSSPNVINMYGKRENDGDTPQSCTLNVAVVNTASDARLKDKVQYLDEETSLEFICKLKPAAYRYTADKDEMYHYGLIYQDVEPIIKSKNCALLGKFLRWEKQPDGENKLVEYGALGYIELISDLIGSVKALTARVQELEGSDKK